MITDTKQVLTHADIRKAAYCVAMRLVEQGLTRAYPIPRGGVPAAYAIQHQSPELHIVDDPSLADCYIDDIYDTGATASRYNDKPFFTLFDKRRTPDLPWLVFPWDGTVEGSAEDIGVRLLQFIGEDPKREGLQETPARFLKAWAEWTSGYHADVQSLFKDFGDGAEGYDEMILIDPIPFYSHCEHHLTAIFGTVHIGYVPRTRIAGLSKFCRLVDVFAKRLQVQERLTVQIADTIVEQLAPLGVGVVVRARHLCMESRGAKKPGAETTTISLKGTFKTEHDCRAEFLSMIKAR